MSDGVGWLTLFNDKGILPRSVRAKKIFPLSIEPGYRLGASEIGEVIDERKIELKNGVFSHAFDIEKTRDTWFKTSALLDLKQTAPEVSKQRTDNRFKQPLSYTFPKRFDGRVYLKIFG